MQEIPATTTPSFRIRERVAADDDDDEEESDFPASLLTQRTKESVRDSASDFEEEEQFNEPCTMVSILMYHIDSFIKHQTTVSSTNNKKRNVLIKFFKGEQVYE